MAAILFDTETTGSVEPQIIEAAWLEIDDPINLIVTDTFEQRYRPEKTIELGALATHHIYDEELVDCPSHTEFQLPPNVQYLIGHNIDYDWRVAGQPDVQRICTLALSRYFYPELDSHSQSAMLYFTHRADARDMLRNAHSAHADVVNCFAILKHLIGCAGRIETWDALWELSEAARIPKVMPFGKHKGTPIHDVPGDYKAWLLRQSDIDPYLVKALQEPSTAQPIA